MLQVCGVTGHLGQYCRATARSFTEQGQAWFFLDVPAMAPWPPLASMAPMPEGGGDLPLAQTGWSRSSHRHHRAPISSASVEGRLFIIWSGCLFTSWCSSRLFTIWSGRLSSARCICLCQGGVFWWASPEWCVRGEPGGLGLTFFFHSGGRTSPLPKVRGCLRSGACCSRILGPRTLFLLPSCLTHRLGLALAVRVRRRWPPQIQKRFRGRLGLD